MNSKPQMPKQMTTMVSVMDTLTEQGFTKNFSIQDNSMKEGGNKYSPEEVKILNFYRFEGITDPGDMSILYAMETNNGERGILVDAYGTYSDPDVDQFIKQVEEINKKTQVNTNI